MVKIKHSLIIKLSSKIREQVLKNYVLLRNICNNLEIEDKLP
jgi:hypothetical protein